MCNKNYLNTVTFFKLYFLKYMGSQMCVENNLP